MKSITVPGFTTDVTAEDQLAIGLFGEQGSGKTRFACTAPEPIGFVPLDRKTRKTVERIAKELGKVILLPTKDFIRVENPMKLAVMKVEAAKVHYRAHVDAIKQACFQLYASPLVKTIVIDTATQLWEDMLFAHFGRSERIMPRDRGSVNQEMVDLLNCLAGKNLILTHKAREVWKDDKPTGRFEQAGFPHLGYHVNVLAEMTCDEKKAKDQEGRFSMNIRLCQDNPDIQGPAGRGLLKDDMITFPILASLIYPDTDPEDWA